MNVGGKPLPWENVLSATLDSDTCIRLELISLAIPWLSAFQAAAGLSRERQYLILVVTYEADREEFIEPPTQVYLYGSRRRGRQWQKKL